MMSDVMTKVAVIISELVAAGLHARSRMLSLAWRLVILPVNTWGDLRDRVHELRGLLSC